MRSPSRFVVADWECAESLLLSTYAIECRCLSFRLIGTLRVHGVQFLPTIIFPPITDRTLHTAIVKALGFLAIKATAVQQQ